MDRSCRYSLTLLMDGACAGYGSALDPELKSVEVAEDAIEHRNALHASGLGENTLI